MVDQTLLAIERPSHAGFWTIFEGSKGKEVQDGLSRIEATKRQFTLGRHQPDAAVTPTRSPPICPNECARSKLTISAAEC